MLSDVERWISTSGNRARFAGKRGTLPGGSEGAAPEEAEGPSGGIVDRDAGDGDPREEFGAGDETYAVSGRFWRRRRCGGTTVVGRP